MKRSRIVALAAVVCCLPVAERVPAQGPEGALRNLLDTPAAPAGYSRLLRNFVVRVPLENGGFETRVDYARLASDAEHRKLCDALGERFLSVNPGTLDEATRKAWAVNAYNFLVIDLVVRNFVNDRGERIRSIADLGKGEFRIFDEKRFEIGGVRYSLNGFESHFLFEDANRESGRVPEGIDPRFHFVLVCGAMGCPPLWPEPFLPETLDEQLDEAVRNALRSPRQIAAGSPVRVSKIFEWYGEDFGGRDGVIAFLRKHAPGEIVTLLDRDPHAAYTPAIEWDWSLNRP